ncbi:MAG: SpoIIE family protein phosphatase [Candidatus Omnitrophota bacterium]
MLSDIDSYLEEKQLKLENGDKILLYTDGVTEAENENLERFGLGRLEEAFQKHSSKPANELMLAIKDEVYSFIGAHPQYDDITLVVLEAQ